MSVFLSASSVQVRSFARLSVCSRHASIYNRKAVADTGETSKNVVREDPEIDALADEKDSLPRLQRPLGVLERPTTAVKTWSERRNELMNQDVRLAQRMHLLASLYLLTCAVSLINLIQVERGVKGLFHGSQCYQETRWKNVDCTECHDSRGCTHPNQRLTVVSHSMRPRKRSIFLTSWGRI
jgi:hypothetical protein